MTTVTAEAPEHSKTVTDILPEDTTYTLKFPSEPVLQKIWLSVIFAHNRNLSNLYRARKAIAKTVKDAGSSSRVRSQNHKSLKKVDALSLRQVMSAAFTTSGSSTPTAPVYVSKTENAVILEFFSMKHDAAQKTLEVTVPKGTDLNLLKRYSPMTRLLERLGRRQWRGDCGGMLIGIEFSAASSSPPADVAALVADATDEPVDESETFEL